MRSLRAIIRGIRGIRCPAAILVPATIAVTLLGHAGSSRADITPEEVERKKAEERKLLPALDRPGQKDPYEDLAAQGEENLKEIQRLLDEIQRNLSREDTGASTQGKQAEAAEKMQSLLEKLEKACKKSSGGEGSGQGQKSADQKQEREEESGKQGEKEEPREAKKTEARTEPQDSDQETRQGQAENRRVGDEVPPEARASLRDQLLEMSRRWGLLPPKLREEMLFSTGREAPPEYLEIISRYYKRLTEFYQESSGR